MGAARYRTPFRLTRQRRGLRALTLVETVVALVVFAVGALAAFSYYSHSRIILNMEARRRIATEIAQSRIEEMRTVAFDDLLSYQEVEQAVELAGVAGSRGTVIEDIDEDDDGVVDYSEVTVGVTWQENGAAREVMLVTYRSPYR